MEKLLNAENDWDRILEAGIVEGPCELISEREVEEAISMKVGKAAGPSEIVVEMLKAAGSKGVKIMTKICTSTRQKIRIFWKIAITFLTLAQNPFNYSKRFNIILEINEGKLVHNYGNFNYKYMYFLKKCIFLRIFI